MVCLKPSSSVVEAASSSSGASLDANVQADKIFVLTQQGIHDERLEAKKQLESWFKERRNTFN